MANPFIRWRRQLAAAIVLVLGAALAVVAGVQPSQAHGGDGLEWRGTLSARPEGKLGVWTVGGKSFLAGAATELDTEEGPLTLNACVKVRYVVDGGVNHAQEIDSEPAGDCNATATSTSTPEASTTPGATGTVTPSSTPVGTPTATSTPAPIEREFRGILGSRPDDVVGVWMIGNRPFVATADTEVKTEEGPLTPGTCTKVHYVVSGELAIAREIESEEMSDCGEHQGTRTPSPTATRPISWTREFQIVVGPVVTRPEGLLGTWTISNTDVVAINSTEFEGSMLSLSVGECVKARYMVSGTVNIARSIEAEDDDDCEHRVRPTPTPEPEGRDHSRVIAKIEALPAAPYIGSWTLKGISYDANSETRMLESRGAFTVGVCVRAHYSEMDDTRTLLRVESLRSEKCERTGEPHEHDAELYGVLETFTSSVPSEWVVSGLTITVNASTTVSASHGPFTTGAFVEVHFTVVDGAIVATKIETHRVPGRGEHNRSGRLTTRPTDELGDWFIDGQRFVADNAIHVDIDRAIGLQRGAAGGQRVIVNYYVTPDGTYVATRISAATSVYLPAMER